MYQQCCNDKVDVVAHAKHSRQALTLKKTTMGANRAFGSYIIIGMRKQKLGYMKVSMCVLEFPSAFMTFCLARENANRERTHPEVVSNQGTPPEMLILTPEHGIKKRVPWSKLLRS